MNKKLLLLSCMVLLTGCGSGNKVSGSDIISANPDSTSMTSVDGGSSNPTPTSTSTSLGGDSTNNPTSPSDSTSRDTSVPSTSTSTSTTQPDISLSTPTGLVVSKIANGFSVEFNEDNTLNYYLYVYYEQNLLNSYPRTINSGYVMPHFAENGTYEARIASYSGNRMSLQCEAVSFVEDEGTGVASPQVITSPGQTKLPQPVDIKITDIGYSWEILFSTGDVVAPGLIKGNEDGFRIYAAYSDGSLVAGYPRSIGSGYQIPKFNYNGFYYIYLQAVGNGTTFANSDLTNFVRIEETNGTKLGTLLDLGVTTTGEASELIAPKGLEMSYTYEYNHDLEEDELVYLVNFDTTPYNVQLTAVDTNGTILSGYPRLVNTGDRLPSVKENGTFYYFLQAMGGTYDGKTYTSSHYTYAVKLVNMDDNPVFGFVTENPAGGLPLTMPTENIRASLTIEAVQDGARNIIYYVRCAQDVFLGDNLRANEYQISIGVSGTLASGYHVLHSSFFDHDSWYVNLHVGKVIEMSDNYEFKAVVTTPTGYMVGSISTFIR